MSDDIHKTEYVGVALPPQIIARIDEQRKTTGQTRQEIIRQTLINGLFKGC